MKTFKKIIFILLLALPFFAFAHEDYSKPHISVEGSAVKEVSPDIVIWQLSLRSEGKKSDELAVVHAKKLTALLAYLNKEGIKQEKIQTQHMQLSENWNYENNKRIKQGYFASSGISFVSDIKSYSALWAGLAAQTDVSVDGSNFELANKIPVEVEARSLALKAAKEKAQSMASVLGAKIGAPLYIEDQSYTDDVREPFQERAMMMKSSDAAGAAIVSPGKLDVRMRVKVIFALQ